MRLLFTSMVTLTLVVFSCNSTKTTGKDKITNPKTEVMDTKKMIEDGFLEGTVVLSKAENDCPVTIKIEGKAGAYFLDPINITEKYESFIVDGTKVWIKYAGLRMMNRCDKASPVNITDLQAR